MCTQCTNLPGFDFVCHTQATRGADTIFIRHLGVDWARLGGLHGYMCTWVGVHLLQMLHHAEVHSLG